MKRSGSKRGVFGWGAMTQLSGLLVALVAAVAFGGWGPGRKGKRRRR